MKKPILSKDTKDATIKKLNDIRNDILEYGASFKTKAILYSEDPGSASKGGAYYGVRKGQFVKPFEEVAFNLQEGEISEPVETEFGFHIIQLIQRKGEELDLRHILIKPIIKQEDLDETRAALDSIKANILRGELTFEEAAKEFSDEESTKFNGGTMINQQTGDNYFELNQLPRDIYFKIDASQEGDISDVIYQETERGEKQFSIIKLVKRIPPHKADFAQDFQKIKQMALAEKKNKINEEWIKNNMSNVYIQIGEQYKFCNYNNPWVEYSQK
jgi:peptidyl-prolyl cis-trans isomerase SurA